jgi:hypothetical protein
MEDVAFGIAYPRFPGCDASAGSILHVEEPGGRSFFRLSMSVPEFVLAIDCAPLKKFLKGIRGANPYLTIYDTQAPQTLRCCVKCTEPFSDSIDVVT